MSKPESNSNFILALVLDGVASGGTALRPALRVP